MTTINERFREVRLTLGSNKKISQEAFAKEIGLSRSELANIEYDKTEPKDFTIKQVCDKFHVNEAWLRHGEGEMFRKMTREQEISKFVGAALTSEPESFRKRFLAMLSRLNTEEWEVLEKMALELADKEKKG